MEVSPAPLELLCAVWVVRHKVTKRQLRGGAGGPGLPAPVAAVVASVRKWARGRKGGHWCREETPFMRAANVGDVQGVLFGLGEMEPHKRGYKSRGALVEAAEGGWLGVVQLLVDDAWSDCDERKDDALFWSAHDGHFAVVRWLVEEAGANVHHRDDHALCLSAVGGHIDILRWLVEKGGANVHVLGDVVLQQSARRGHGEVVAWLLSRESGLQWTLETLERILEKHPHPQAVYTAFDASPYGFHFSTHEVKRHKKAE